MPYAHNIRCRTCGKAVRGTKNVEFAERMKKLRRHYKAKHPKKFRASIRKGLKTKRRRGLIK